MSYHPYRTDTFALIPDDSIRAAPFPHVPGKPTLVVNDSVIDLPENPDDLDSVVGRSIAVAKSESSYIDLSVSGRAGAGQCSVFVTGVKLDESPMSSNLRLFCVVTEDSLREPLGGRAHRVARRFLPDYTGQPFLIAARLDTLRDTLTFAPGDWDLGQLGAALFIEDVSTRRIRQAAVLARFSR